MEGMDMTVFVVQKQMKYDTERGELIPRFPSIHKASKWGDLKYLLSPSAHPFDPDLIIGELHDALIDFCDDDYLLLIGSPALIGMATSIAAHYNDGKVKFLQWSGNHDNYTEIEAKIY